MLSVYAISGPNGRKYVGQSIQTKGRQQKHFNEMRRGIHHCVKLQRAWNKHGEDNFSFGILAFVDDDSVIDALEQEFIDWHAARDGAYNSAPVTAGGFVGKPHSAATREKIGSYHRGKQVSAETRAKLAAATKKQKSPTLGKRYSAEERAARSARMKAYYAENPKPAKNRARRDSHGA